VTVSTLPPESATRPDAPPATPVPGRWTPPVIALAVGVGLGPVDLLLQRVLPYPFADLADSPAVWALVAFAVGWCCRGRWWPAAAGTLALVLAVEGYYATAVLALGDDPSTLTDASAEAWLVMGVAAGLVFGTAGAWARSAHVWRGPLGTATAVGVLLAEAWLDLARAAGTEADAGFRHDQVQTALVLVVLAGLAAVLAGRSARQRVAGLALALPIALAGALAFSTLGFL